MKAWWVVAGIGMIEALGGCSSPEPEDAATQGAATPKPSEADLDSGKTPPVKSVPSAQPDATARAETPDANDCTPCNSDAPKAASISCYCKTPGACPTLEEMKAKAAVPVPEDAGYDPQFRWSVMEGCGRITFETHWGAGDGEEHVFETATGKVVGIYRWTDTGGSVCDSAGISWDGYEGSYSDICPEAHEVNLSN